MQFLTSAPNLRGSTDPLTRPSQAPGYMERTEQWPAWSRTQHHQLRSPIEDALVSAVFGALSALEALCDNAFNNWHLHFLYCLNRKCWHPGLGVCDEMYRRCSVPSLHHQTFHILTNAAVFKGDFGDVCISLFVALNGNERLLIYTVFF